MDDVVTKKDLYVRPFGIFIGDTVSDATFRSFVESGRMRLGDDIISRVSREPEQSLERATSQIPELAMTSRSGSHRLRYYPLGFPGSREKYGLDYNGNLFISKKSSKAMKEDLAGMLWEGDQIYFRVGTGDMPDFRERENSARQELLEGWLPLVTTRWEGGALAFEEQAYSALVNAPLEDEQLKGDEPSVTFLKLIVRNPQTYAATARVWFMVSPGEELRYDRGLLLGTANSHGAYAHPRLRATLQASEGSIEMHSVPRGTAPLDGQSGASYGSQAAVWTMLLPPAHLVHSRSQCRFGPLNLPAIRPEYIILSSAHALARCLTTGAGRAGQVFTCASPIPNSTVSSCLFFNIFLLPARRT
jgi:hypothetical protein